MSEPNEESCDIRIWCPDCERSDYATSGDKYLCTTCGKAMESPHSVHHEIFPHVAGDKDGLH